LTTPYLQSVFTSKHKASLHGREKERDKHDK
jgi:hypothetical protein